MPTDEEARAQAYRDQQARRVAYQANLQARLHGDPAAREQLRQAWQPVVDAALERDSCSPRPTRP